jgi:hypothetical protein
MKVEPYRLLLCMTALLCGCSIPKHYSLSDVEGFTTGCALLREGGKLWSAKYSQGVLNKARRVTFFRPGQLRGRGMREDDTALPRGTRLVVKDIKKWWDFENSHRLFITGTLVIDGREQSFSFDEATPPVGVPPIQEYLMPCEPSHGL